MGTVHRAPTVGEKHYDNTKIYRIHGNRVCNDCLGDCFFGDVLMDSSGQGERNRSL